MDFGAKQLEKYGWVKGDGLGKSLNGAAEPIKVRLKRDSAGIGCGAGSEFTSTWWSKVFNQAAKAINVQEENENGVVTVQTTTDASLKRTRKHYGNHRKELYHDVIRARQPAKKEIEEEEEDANDSDNEGSVGVEEMLFEACGGRTAHKAARHGHKVSGKLQRLEEHEKALERELEMIEHRKRGSPKRRKVLMEDKDSVAEGRKIQNLNSDYRQKKQKPKLKHK